MGNIHVMKGDGYTYTLKCYTGTRNIGSQAATKENDLPFSFSWDTKDISVGDYVVIVELYKRGCPSASDSVKIYIFRPDIDIGLGEDKEEEEGGYIHLGKSRNCTIRIEGSLQEGEITLNCNNPNKISLWSGSNQLSFPYTCSVSQLPKTLTIKGENTSNTIKDITLTLTTSKGGEDKAKITVFKISLSASPSSICAGGSIHSNLDICKSEIIATTTPPIEGINVNFEIGENKGEDIIENRTYYNLETEKGSLTSSSSTTGNNGKGSVYLISSQNASSPEKGLYYYEGVRCLYNGEEVDRVWVAYESPEYDLDIFLDPETGEPVEYLIADGESQVINRVKITYNSTPLPNHTIRWKFKFWTIDTLEQASQNKYGMSFFDLTQEQREDIFNTTSCDYEGQGPSEYGTLTSSSVTDTTGIATSIYTSGTEAGFIEFWYEDTSMRKAERGSFLFVLPIGVGKWGKEKAKLRIWLDAGGEFEYPESVKTILKNQCFNFLEDRFEFINEQIQPRLKNDRYVYNQWRAGMTWEQTGAYDTFEHYKIYVCLEKIRWFYEQGSYPNQNTLYDVRAAYTIAHEIEHTYQPIWIGSGHHDNCSMIPNITALPNSQNWQSFCETCKNRIKNGLGD